MPVYFVAILNQTQELVLYATYETQQFREIVKQKASIVKKMDVYHTERVEYSKRVNIFYRSLGKFATCALVVSRETSLQDVGACFDHFVKYVEERVLGKSEYTPPTASDFNFGQQDEESQKKLPT